MANAHSKKVVPAWSIEPFDRDQKGNATSYLVRSVNERGNAYVVDVSEGTCGCMDYSVNEGKTPGYRCKHLEAVFARITKAGRLGFVTSTSEQIEAVGNALRRLQRINAAAIKADCDTGKMTREEAALHEVLTRLHITGQDEAEAPHPSLTKDIP